MEGCPFLRRGAVFKRGGTPNFPSTASASRATVSDGRSHKENAPSPGPIRARPKLTRSAPESSGPQQVRPGRPERASPQQRRPCPRPLPPRRRGPRRASPHPVPVPGGAAARRLRGSGGERARTLALGPAEKSRESPRVPRRQKQARPPPARARGAPGSPCRPPASCPPPSPLAARTPRQVGGGPRLPAEKRGERA